MTSTAAILIALVMVGSMLAVLSIAMVGGAVSNSASVTAAVAPLSAGSPTPGPTVDIDYGQSVFLNAAPSGGTPPYYITWYSEPSSSTTCGATPVAYLGSGAQTTVVTPGASSTTYVCFIAQDSVGATSVSTMDAVVTSALTLSPGAPTPGAPIVDLGMPVTLEATPSGGTAPYSFQWYSGPSTGSCTMNELAGQTGKYLNTTPSPSSDLYCYKVTDSSVGFPSVAAMTSTQDTISEGAALVAAPVTGTSWGDAVPPGLETLSFKAHDSGGVGPLTIQWYSSPTSGSCSAAAPIVGAITSPYTPTSISASTYFCYSVTDTGSVASTGQIVTPPLNAPPTIYSAEFLFTVNSTLTANPITTPDGAPSLDLGTTETVNLEANPTGGAPFVPPLTYMYSPYAWTYGFYPVCSLDTNPIGVNGNHYNATVATGSQWYCYSVTDGNGTVAATVNGLFVTVYPAVVAGVPSPAAPTIDFGQSVTLSAVPSGGTGTYTAYQWYYGVYAAGSCPALPTSWTEIATATAATYSAASSPTAPYMTAAGTYCFDYTVQDNSNGSAPSAMSPPAIITVDPALAAGLPLAHGPAPSFPTLYTPFVTPNGYDEYYLDQGQSVQLTAQPGGGTLTSTYVYQWFSGSSAPTATGCGSDSAIATATSQIYVATPTATAFYCYTVTDGSVNAPTAANGALVSWNATETAGPITAPGFVTDPQSPAVSITLTANPAGGTPNPAYTYAWSYGIAPSPAYPTGTGTPLCTADTAVAPSLVSGFSGSVNSPTLTVDPTYSTYFCYTVTDTADTPVMAPLAGAFLVQVSLAPLTAYTAAYTSLAIDIGQSAVLTAIPGGGTGVYVAYQWFTSAGPGCASPSLIAGATAQSYTYSPTAVSVGLDFCYRVTDSSYGNLAQRSAMSTAGPDIVVSPALVAYAPLCTPTAALTCGTSGLTSASLSAAYAAGPPQTGATGGSGGFTYLWYAGPSTVCSLDGATGVAGTPYVPASSTGEYFCYGVTDSNGNTALSPTVYVAAY